MVGGKVIGGAVVPASSIKYQLVSAATSRRGRHAIICFSSACDSLCALVCHRRRCCCATHELIHHLLTPNY